MTVKRANEMEGITCPLVVESGNYHFELVCEDCDAERMSRASLGQVEGWYHVGRITQDDYEAFCFVFDTLSGLRANPVRPEIPAVRRIARKLLQLRPALETIQILGKD